MFHSVTCVISKILGKNKNYELISLCWKKVSSKRIKALSLSQVNVSELSYQRNFKMFMHIKSDSRFGSYTISISFEIRLEANILLTKFEFVI